MKSSYGRIVIAMCVATAIPAEASRPVPRTVTGCVAAGKLTDGHYTYRVSRRTASGLKAVDLSRHEGRAVRVQGELLPGDLLIARSIEETTRHCRPAPVRK